MYFNIEQIFSTCLAIAPKINKPKGCLLSVFHIHVLLPLPSVCS